MSYPFGAKTIYGYKFSIIAASKHKNSFNVYKVNVTILYST